MTRKEQGEDDAPTEDIPGFREALSAWEGRVHTRFSAFRDARANAEYCMRLLSRGAVRLYTELCTRPAFIAAVAAATEAAPENRRHWRWHLLMNTPFLRVGLITVYRSLPIPLHDHPGAFGMQRVINGSARVRQYQPLEEIDHHQTLVSLERVSDQVFAPGECASFQPAFANLHELESVSSRCVLLSMMANPYRPEQRAWYYPVPMAQSGDRGLYSRVRPRHAARAGTVLKTAC